MSYVLWIIGGIVAGLSAFYLADKASALLHRWMPRFTANEWHAYLWSLIAAMFLTIDIVKISLWWLLGVPWLAYRVVVLVREHRSLIKEREYGI